MRPIPLAYLITFSCYGARLHGDESGSVDRSHNVYGTPLLASNPSRVSSEERRTKQTPYCLDGSRRAIVLAAVVELCAHREWRLLAAHIRTQHVHMVIAAEDAPEKVLEDAKIRQPGAPSRRHGGWNPATMDPARQHTLSLETRERGVRDSLCGARARGTDGDLGRPECIRINPLAMERSARMGGRSFTVAALKENPYDHFDANGGCCNGCGP